MATQIICDRCKSIIKNTHINPRGYEVWHNGNEMDLCGSCYMDIVRIIESKPIFSKNPNEEADLEKEN